MGSGGPQVKVGWQSREGTTRKLLVKKNKRSENMKNLSPWKKNNTAGPPEGSCYAKGGG